jgi:hypothetical protein
MQYLVTMDFVDPGPVLPPQEFLAMARQAVLPGHEALSSLKSEGKTVAGGFPVGERAIVPINRVGFPKRARRVIAGRAFLGNN